MLETSRYGLYSTLEASIAVKQILQTVKHAETDNTGDILILWKKYEKQLINNLEKIMSKTVNKSGTF